MFEKYMIMSRGFQNVVEDGKVTGFQLKIRITYYRGIYLALISDYKLTVDGETIAPEQLRFTVGGRTYTLEEMAHEEKARWEFGDPATLTVLKQGGLEPGIHEIELEQTVAPAYVPARGFFAVEKRKVTLVA